MDMFSRMEPLFKTQFRQTEAADARLALREEEKDRHKKPKEGEDDLYDDSALWEDKTSVSVEALRAFLISFLQSQIDLEKTAAAKTLGVQSPAPENDRPMTALGAKAAQAYQSHATLPRPTVSEAPAEGMVGNEEVRIMNALITKLDRINNAGISALTIERADTFLTSLTQAIDKALETI